MLQQAERYFQTIRYLRARQIYYRAYYALRGRALALLPTKNGGAQRCEAPTNRFQRPFPLLSNPVREHWKVPCFTSPETFTFVGHTFYLRSGWFPDAANDLWIFNLHYFDYLNQSADLPACLEILERWLDEVPPGHPIAWHSYPTSLRIANWIWFYGQNESQFHEGFKERFLQSLYDQLLQVRSHLEYHLGGNHLFENLKALIIGACFFSEPDERDKALRLLQRELTEQICSDGGHYERSPMYHLIVLEGLFAIASALKDSNEEPPPWLEEHIRKMVRFADIAFARDTFPLLNDSSSEIAVPWAILRPCIEKLGLAPTEKSVSGTHHLGETGLVFCHREDLSVCFDVGPIGPDHLPGHAHNDTLSLLCSYQGEPVLTDSGVYEYAEGEWRNYFRSARAHNVIYLNDTEPNDVWKSFRVGYRGHPYNVNVTDSSFSANDSAYERLGVKWRRTVYVSEQEPEIEIVDRLEGAQEAFPLEWNFHFAPSFDFVGDEGASELRLQSDLSTVFITIEGDGVEIERRKSWISLVFGQKEERACLRLQATLSVSNASEVRIRFLFSTL